MAQKFLTTSDRTNKFNTGGGRELEGSELVSLLEMSYYTAEEEYKEHTYTCDAIETAIQVVQDDCEKSEHQKAILYELVALKEHADEELIRLKNVLDAADRLCSEAEQALMRKDAAK